MTGCLSRSFTNSSCKLNVCLNFDGQRIVVIVFTSKYLLAAARISLCALIDFPSAIKVTSVKVSFFRNVNSCVKLLFRATFAIIKVLINFHLISLNFECWLTPLKWFTNPFFVDNWNETDEFFRTTVYFYFNRKALENFYLFPLLTASTEILQSYLLRYYYYYYILCVFFYSSNIFS